MGIAGIGKGGALFGTGTTAAFVDLGLAPGTTDQREDLSFRKSLTSVATLQHFFLSPNLIWFLMALTTHVGAPYDLSTGTPAASWCASRFVLNFTIAFTYYGFFHYGLYIAGWADRKFSPGSYPTAANMRHNLYYWSLGIVQWTFWEYVMTRVWMSGNAGVSFATDAEILASPSLLAWNVFWVLAIPVWRDLHFYIAHRFIHVRAIYKFVHSLHHRNMDPEPFSGMTMHPVEHIYYFSNAFVPSLFLNGLSPLIFTWCFFHLTIAPGAGHSGWEDNFQADQYHYVHHAKFECNYGSPFSAFIDQFFGTFREKLGESVAYRGEAKEIQDPDAMVVMTESSKEERVLEQEKKPKKMPNKLKKKKEDATKVWSAKGVLGVPATKVEMIYTLFWMSLFPVAWFGAVSNHDKDGNGLVVERLMVGIGDITIGIPTLVAAYVAYFPPLVALVLCWIGGDKMSWRWPFQKESVVGTFGLFVLLGWAACIHPIFCAMQAVCMA